MFLNKTPPPSPDRFTAEDAFEAREDGEPVLLDHRAARRLCEDHGATIADYIEDCGTRANYDAADLLAWLGY